MNKVMETSRLLLREYEYETDLKPLFRLFTHEEAMRYYGGTKTEEETKAWINWNVQSYADNGFGLFALVEKQDNTFIGHCGLILQKDVDGVNEIEIGYALHPDFQGLGYAGEAALACKKFVFNTLKKYKVISLIDPENIPSIKVALAIGMHFEKEIQRWDKTIHVYSITSEE